MKVRKIALQLSGKLPPDYKKYNRLEFMDYLEEIFEIPLEKIDFYRKQANQYEEEFYFLVLDFLQRKSEKEDGMKEKRDKLLVELNLDNTPDRLVLQPTYENEADFTQNFLVPFFRKLGYRDVKYTHGRKEYGKDIVMRKQDEFGNRRYIGVQAKVGDVSGAASGLVTINTLIQQVQDGFAMAVPSLDEKDKVYISEFIIVTNEYYTENAEDKILEKIKEPSQLRNIHFLDKTKIENLLLEIQKS